MTIARGVPSAVHVGAERQLKLPKSGTLTRKCNKIYVIWLGLMRMCLAGQARQHYKEVVAIIGLSLIDDEKTGEMMLQRNVMQHYEAVVQ